MWVEEEVEEDGVPLLEGETDVLGVEEVVVLVGEVEEDGVAVVVGEMEEDGVVVVVGEMEVDGVEVVVEGSLGVAGVEGRDKVEG